MKKIITLVFIIFATVHFVFAQTATVTLADYATVPGQVVIPLDYTNFIDIGAITLYIEYDQNVASYNSFNTGDLNGALVSTWQSSGSNYILGVSWTDITGLTSSAGTLIELVFNYTGGTTPLAFQSNCELGNLLGNVVAANYTDGSISPEPNAVPVTIISQMNLTPASPPNNYVEVPVEADFSNVANGGVGSFNFEIEYDNAILTFNQITLPFESGFTINTLTNPARVSVVWTTQSATNGSTINGLLFNMKFTYNGGNSDLLFVTAASEVADFTAIPLSVVYADGMVTQDPATGPNVIIGSVSSLAGTTVLIPVTVQNFETYVPDFGAFDFSIGFNSAQLQFVSLQNINSKISTGLLYGTITDELNIAWNASTAGITFVDDELLFNLEFNYSGTNQDVVFNTANCVMSNWDTSPIFGFYFNGSVTEIPGGNATVSMPFVIGTQQTVVSMPVEQTGFQNVGAITLQIEFDPNLLIYLYTDNVYSELLSKGSYIANCVNGVFVFSWTVNPVYGTGVNIPDINDLFNINFFYKNGIADLAFSTSNCAIADFNTDLIYTLYTDGQIRSEVFVPIKAMLQGPYNLSSGEMNQTLKFIPGVVPISQPYNVPPWNYPGTESINPLPADAVDWVLVELRSSELAVDVVERRAALILKNGDIVQYNNPSLGVAFSAITPSSPYYIVVYHRNHMPVMSATAVVLPLVVSPYDFTNVSNCYGNLTDHVAIELETGVYGMIAGDINSDGYLKYSGPSNDRGMILAKINALTDPTYLYTVAFGYHDEDVLMDYTISYLPTPNDRGIMIPNLIELTGSSLLNSIYQSVVPGVAAKSGVINDGPINIFINETVNELQLLGNTDETLSNAWVDNVQFTLSWAKEANSMVMPLLENAVSNFGLIAQGEPIEKEDKMYLVFVSVNPVEMPSPFTTSDEIILLSMIKDEAITIGDNIQIADDSYTNNINGAYYISLFGEDNTGEIQTSVLDVTELFESSLSIYPNPTTNGLVCIEMNLAKSQNMTISIHDLNGRVIIVKDYQPATGLFKTEMNVSNLDRGVYLIKVSGDKLNTIQKLVIQ